MSKQKQHEYTRSVLPWYVNESLGSRDMARVFAHLADCEDCRRERDQLYELQNLVRESQSPIVDSELSFRRLMKRIDAAEENERSLAEPTHRISASPRTRGWSVAAAAVLILAVALGIGTSEPPRVTEFQTLSSDPVSTGHLRRLELGFVSPIPATTLREALIETKSNLISGPDPDGRYLVEVMVPGDMSADGYLDQIRDIEGVAHASFASR